MPSLTLSKLIEMLWDMIRYENFDVNSPYNRDAAIWAREQDEFELPLDGRAIRDPGEGESCLIPPRVKQEEEVVFIGDCSERVEIEFI